MRKYALILVLLASALWPGLGSAQVDPDKRELLQAGFAQPLEGASPLTAYGFYYLNEPNYFKTNTTLRLALAPVYLDSEVGFVHLLGPNTDLGLGFAGGAFADSYYEIRRGKYFPDESFFGNSVEGSASIYHLFDPGKLIPLYGVMRIKEHYSVYTGDRTAESFVLPHDHSTVDWRAGLRFGGREPLLSPDLAMELSVWGEGQYRTDSGAYGFNGDRDLNEYSQLFWGRALLIYTLPDSKKRFEVNFNMGTSLQADRFSAYRLGGNMPVISEFPLSIPGYFYQELSARNFASFNGQYSIPIDNAKQWRVAPMGAIATVDYIPGEAQPSHFNSGVGLGLGYRSKTGVWQALASYGYGFEAIRSSGRGGQAVGFLLQIDLEARHPGQPSFLDDAVGFLHDHL